MHRNEQSLFPCWEFLKGNFRKTPRMETKPRSTRTSYHTPWCVGTHCRCFVSLETTLFFILNIWKRVYFIIFQRGSDVYTCETVEQHEGAVRNKVNLLPAYQHVAQNNHTMNFPGAKFFAKSKQEKPRKLLEDFYTYSDLNSINRSQYFSEFYIPIIQKNLKNWMSFNFFKFKQC